MRRDGNAQSAGSLVRECRAIRCDARTKLSALRDSFGSSPLRVRSPLPTTLACLLALLLAAAHPVLGQIEQLWAVRLTNEFPQVIQVDSTGHVLITGAIGMGPDSDYSTRKFDAHGNLRWSARYSSPGDDSAYLMSVDGSGNIYVSGSRALVKYDTAGNQLWVAALEQNNRESVRAVDAAGNAYAVGTDTLMQYGTNGNRNWFTSIAAHCCDFPVALALDNTGNIYVAGATYTGPNDSDYVVLKFDSAGNQVWQAQYGGHGNGLDSATALAVDIAGNVYVTGFLDLANFCREFQCGSRARSATVKFSPQGHLLWVATDEFGIGPSFFGCSLAVDGEGNAYVTGMFYPAGAGPDGMTSVVKYTSNGNQLWLGRYPFASQKPRVVVVEGNAYVRFDQGLIKYDTNGTRVWDLNLDPRGNSFLESFALDNAGNFYLAGPHEYGTQTTPFVGIVRKYVQTVVEGSPKITVPPQNQTVVLGTNVEFSIQAVGNPPLSYQWFHNGGAIGGATNATLLLSNIHSTDFGCYSVEVTNSIGATASAWARLSRLQGPRPQFENQCNKNGLAVGGGLSIFGAYSHMLALKIDGSLWAWGVNFSGQLGDGTTTDRATPVLIDYNWISVAAGATHSVGVKSDGSLWAWGNGQTKPQRIGRQNDWAATSAGSDFSVALKRDGSLWAWGNNRDYQLGTETPEPFVSEPIRIGTDTDWATVRGGQFSTVALKTDGSLWMWGGQRYVLTIPTSVGTDHDWAQVWAGYPPMHSALKNDGSLWAWDSITTPPVRIAPANDWVSIDTRIAVSCGQGGCFPTARVALAVDRDGSLWRHEGLIFTRSNSGSDWAAVTINHAPSGGMQSLPRVRFLGLKTDGTLWDGWWADSSDSITVTRVNDDTDWGPQQSFPVPNEFRIVRHGLDSGGLFRAVVAPVSNDCYVILHRGTSVTNINQPVAVGLNLNSCANSMQLTDPASVSSSASVFYRARQVSLAQPLDSDGDGIDDVYELRHAAFLNPLNLSDAAEDFDGDGRSNLQEYRVGANPAIRSQALATGSGHFVALRTDGSLWAWGTNVSGEIGDGTMEPRYESVRVGSEANWAVVDAAGRFDFSGVTMALKSDGSLWIWGSGQTSPARVGTDNDWFTIAAGVESSVALRADGSLWSVSLAGVTRIGPANDWVAINAGARHVLALRSDGSLWAWGENEVGQLGDGTFTNRTVPVRVGTDTDWNAIAAGGFQSVALKRDGSLWAWGLAWEHLDQSKRPVRIGADADWATISASGSDDIFDSAFVAVKNDGSLWIQNGSLIQNAPARVGADTDWRTVAAKPNGGLVALKTDGSLWILDWHDPLPRLPQRIGTDTNWGSPP